MSTLSVNVFRLYPPRTPMHEIVRAEAMAGRGLINDPRRAGYSVRRKTGNPPPSAA